MLSYFRKLKVIMQVVKDLTKLKNFIQYLLSNNPKF